VMGAFSAGLFYGIGSSGFLNTNTALKTAAHGLAGGTLNVLQGGKFGHGFASAFVTQAAGGQIDRIDSGNVRFSPARVVAAATLGGTVSAATGGKFSNGAISAAFSRAFNHEMHSRAMFDAEVWREEMVLSDSGDWETRWESYGTEWDPPRQHQKLIDVLAGAGSGAASGGAVGSLKGAFGALAESLLIDVRTGRELFVQEVKVVRHLELRTFVFVNGREVSSRFLAHINSEVTWRPVSAVSGRYWVPRTQACWWSCGK
jgi:hypothetical protein